ncbi:hypothetical protein [Paraburkholderia bengalensis]
MTKQRDLDGRQVLSVIGNRYVVFGPVPGLDQPAMFDPDRDASVLPRVADESDFAPERLIQSLRVYGMKRVSTPESESSAAEADLVLADHEGAPIFIDVKVRAHSPKSRDLNAGYDQVRLGRDEGRNVEVWHFNTERLNLLIQAYDGGMPVHCELPPVDVWEKTESSLFRRDQVVAEVARWEKDVKQLYTDVSSWYGDIPDVKFELSRTVTMSEELMQKFAVSDRELPILDVVAGGQVLASFVPRGLWLIGAWGRIDVITQTQTRTLIMTRVENGGLEWCIVSPENRRETQPLTSELMRRLLEAA